jgi:5-methylcytosine-specific restriction endonuclease McrA
MSYNSTGEKRRRWKLRFWKQWVKRSEEKSQGLCYYCSRQIYLIMASPNDRKQLDDEATIDHVVPRSRGGSSKMENLVFSCLRCNLEKADIRLY